ncbi:MAG TPA: glycosyltransferase family 39 protein [Gemmataceae bacterium]|nr:glycosyltransferase family 39 protein [Gemmataceae bacterium]
MEGPAASPPARKQTLKTGATIRLEIPPETNSATQSAEPGPALRWELALLAVLLLLAASSRAWLLGHTEVAARDSVGFIRYALELERDPWKEVLRRNLQHPGYPIVLLTVSWPVRYFLGGTNAVSMQLSAQLASALAGVLLVIPMYFLGRDLFGRRVGFWGTALFQCLPVSARVMSDALSEATFLLFTATALLLAVRALRSYSVTGFALCGLFSGLAYWTRPEGALIAVAAGLVLVAMPFVAAGPQLWRRVLGCGIALLLVATVVSSPYALITGRLTNKPTPRKLWETAVSAERSQNPGPLTASVLASYAPENLQDRHWWGLYAIATEVIKDFQYLSVLPLLLGMWWFRNRLKSGGGIWVLLVLCALHFLILWRLAVVVGYVSDRHVLVLVLCGVYLVAGGVLAISECITLMDRRRLSLMLFLVLIGLGLVEALKPLHANRIGHRQAGLWLAEHTELADPIVDPFCWAHYYAGRVFWEGRTPPAPPGYVPTQYVVLERSPSSDHSRLPTIDHAKALAARGRLIYRWPVEKTEAEAKILVFAVRP